MFVAKLDDKQIKEYIGLIDKKLKDYKRLFAVLSPFVYQDIIDHFAKEQGPDGKWKARSEFTKMAYEKQGKSGRKLLQVTGALRQSILPGQMVEKQSGSTAEYIANIVYSGIHNYGGTIKAKGRFLYLPITKKGVNRAPGAKRNIDFILTKSVTIPKREFMWLSNKKLEDMSNAILYFLAKE